MNQSYLQIINYLKLFADNHIGINRFLEEDLDQMSNRTSTDEEFPMMFVTPLYNTTYDTYNEYKIRIYIYDRLMKDRSNITNARSRTNDIIMELDAWLREGDYSLPFDVMGIGTVSPISSQLMTDITGWYLDINIETEKQDVCNLPLTKYTIEDC